MAAAAVAVLVAVVAGACRASSGDGPVGKTLVVGVDLPLQGSAKDGSQSMVDAMRLHLDQVGGAAGRFRVELNVYDNSTATKGAWDEEACRRNAAAHVANAGEVAVVGPLDSGCAKLMLPALANDPQGPMLMVSHATSYPGLTKEWEAGEPGRYYPTGIRHFARVYPSDDLEGPAVAQFLAKEVRARRCFVLNDGDTFGAGVARAFAAEARRQGIEVVGEASWDPKATSYAALFAKVKAADPDCVYLGGIYDNNGAQLIRDKVRFAGDNTVVRLVAPSGFIGYAELERLPEAQNMYLTFGGRATEQQRAAGERAARFLDAYRARYGADPASSYALYAAVALQVVLAAIARSDGTRRGVRDALFNGDGFAVSTADSLLGKYIRIDTRSGDMLGADISLLRLEATKPTFLRTLP